ncbi:MAG TPA: ABC transporter permease [Thermoanaerobaculia bacterium]|nr:ABC transporter permease [Thermoanaerobaculia bacterium]
MRKMLAVLKREYLAAVRKKMFIVMTILFPVLMSGAMILPGLIVARGLGEKHVAVLDGTSKLRSAFTRTIAPERIDPKQALRGRNRNELPQTIRADYVDGNVDSKPYLDRLNADRNAANRLDGVFVIPRDAIDGADAKLTYYSRSSTDIITQERLASIANRAIQRIRLSARGIDPNTVEALTRSVPVDGVQLSRSGEQKKGGELNLIIAILFAAFLLIPSFIYGLEIMRGIIQEKNDRVVEVLVSSMSPRQLLTGKICGVALVGLTQVTAWMLMLAAVGTWGAAVVSMAGVNISQFLRPMVFVYFFLFFILAYMTYVCIYAIAGAVCNSEKEAQQLIAPISLLMMLPWFLMFAIVTNPDSGLAVGFSLSPVFAPLTMFVRALVSEPPVAHILIAVAVSLATICAFFWATAKIFRIGILSYGKRPTIGELWQWLKVA